MANVKKQLLGAFVLVIAVAVQQLGVFPIHNGFTNSLTNWMHIPMFAAITIAVLWAWPSIRPGMLIVSLVIVALATEALQSFTGREPSMSDLLKDALGALAGFVFMQSHTNRRRYAVVAITIIVTMAAPSIYLVGYAHQYAIFPTLFEPGSALSKILNNSSSKPQYTSAHSWSRYRDQQVLALQWGSGSWPGVDINETVEDWHDYTNFVFDVFNLESNLQPLTIGLRHIRDNGTSNRYHSVQLAPGDNQIKVDLSNLIYLDTGQPALVKHLKFYTTPDHAGKRILLGRVWLE